MPAGELSPRQGDRIRQAVRTAESILGDIRFSVYVGALGSDSRAAARVRHAQLTDPDHSVLVAVDPIGRALEIVTGAIVTLRLDDRGCALAAATMASDLAHGDVVRGVEDGLSALVAHTRSL